MTDEDLIAGRTLLDWEEFARRDDCFAWMVPSDLRQLVGAVTALLAKRDAALVEGARLREAHKQFISRVEDGLTWNSSQSQCLWRIEQLIREERAAISTIKDQADAG